MPGGSTRNLVELEPPLGLGDDGQGAFSDPVGTLRYEGHTVHTPIRPREAAHPPLVLSKPKTSWPHPTLPDSVSSGVVKQLGFRKAPCEFSVLFGL